MQEITKKKKFDSVKDESANPFFVLLKFSVDVEEPENLTGNELALIWTEFARKWAHLHPYSGEIEHTTKGLFDSLAKHTCLGYNKLEFKTKVHSLNQLIDSIYSTELFKNNMKAKTDAVKPEGDKDKKVPAEKSDVPQLPALQTATCLGADVHKNEYWTFLLDTKKLYVRVPQGMNGEEEWLFYDKKVCILLYYSGRLMNFL